MQQASHLYSLTLASEEVYTCFFCLKRSRSTPRSKVGGMDVTGCLGKDELIM